MTNFCIHCPTVQQAFHASFLIMRAVTCSKQGWGPGFKPCRPKLRCLFVSVNLVSLRSVYVFLYVKIKRSHFIKKTKSFIHFCTFLDRSGFTINTFFIPVAYLVVCSWGSVHLGVETSSTDYFLTKFQILKLWWKRKYVSKTFQSYLIFLPKVV